VIHRDIVSVWNIRNSNVEPFHHHTHHYGTDLSLLQYLAGEEFKAKMIVLVDDLVVNPITPT